MKLKLLKLSVFFFLSVIFLSCSSGDKNSFTFQNMAAGDVYVNFRGTKITVATGKTVIVKDIPQGTYDYSTTYEIPSGATTSATSGPLSGTVTLKAGTKILLIYSSAFENDTYKIGATISSSDDIGTSSTTGT